MEPINILANVVIGFAAGTFVVAAIAHFWADIAWLLNRRFEQSRVVRIVVTEEQREHS